MDNLKDQPTSNKRTIALLKDLSALLFLLGATPYFNVDVTYNDRKFKHFQK